MSRTRNVKSGMITGAINQLVGLIFPFITRTLMIRYMGNEYLGLGSLFTSVLQVLSLSELGFGVAITYLLYKPVQDNDIVRINKILNFYRKIYWLIGTAILVISLILTFFLPNLISGEYPADINLYVLFWIYVINTSVSYFLFAYKRVLLSANQRYDIDIFITLISSLFRYLVQIIAIWQFKNYYIYAIAIPVCTVLDNIISTIVVNKRYPCCKPSGSIDRSEIRGIVKNVGGAFCAKIGSTVFLSADSIIISAFLGLYILGTYNNYYYIISMFINLFAVLHNSLRPVIGNYWVTEDREKNWNVFRIMNLGYMMIVNLICGCCLGLMQKFEMLWGGTDNFLDFRMVVYLVVCFFVGRITCIPGIYKEATGILWEGKFISLISAFLNLALNIILVQLIGLDGVLISSIIASAAVTIPGYIYVMKRTIFSDVGYEKYYVKFILIQTMQAFIVCLVCYAMDYFIEWHNSWFGFFLEGIMLVVVSGLLLILMNLWQSDFQAGVQFLNSKRRRKV